MCIHSIRKMCPVGCCEAVDCYHLYNNLYCNNYQNVQTVAGPPCFKNENVLLHPGGVCGGETSSVEVTSYQWLTFPVAHGRACAYVQSVEWQDITDRNLGLEPWRS